MSMDGRYPENAGAIFRVCGMDGILKMQEQFSGYVGWWQVFAPAKPAFPPSLAVVS